MNRRQLLAALGLTAGSLTLPSLGRAQSGPPLRFVLFYTAQGCVPSRWVCQPPGRPLDQDWVEDWSQWDASLFSDSLRPLHRWRDQVTAIGGLSLVSAEADGDGFRHERAQAHSIAGANAAWIGGFPYVGAATIDQRIADTIARSDRYRSLEISVSRGLAYDGYGSIINRGPNQPLPVIDDPRVLWDRLFGQGGSAGDPVIGAQGSVLDAVAGRYDALSKRLSGEDQQKLELHRDLVRNLEQRVGGLAAAACDEPSRATGYGAYDEDFDQHADAVVAALSCDLTRVASFQMGQLSMAQLGLGPGDVHADVAHEIYSNPVAEDGMTAYQAYHAEQHFTRLLDKLAAVPEGGGTLLDNTVVVWMSEMADSWHGFDQYPVVYAGGGGVLPLGRYVNYARREPFRGLKPIEEPVMGVPHQRFLTSLLSSFGVADPTFGVTSVEGIDGAVIDCTGDLAELRA
ncbi:MAG: DUF1552 domain-containing protein [Myxococcota bacterium]